NYEISCTGQGRSKTTSIQILGQQVAFRLRERLRQNRQNNPTGHSYIEYELTGDFLLEITHQYSYEGRKVWADGKKQRVEDCIQSFIEGMVLTADAERKNKERRQREHEEWVRLEEERRELEEELRLEEQRLNQLEQEATIWKRSQVLRDYIKAVRTGLHAGISSPALVDKNQQWLDWATDHVNRLDPLHAEGPSTYT
ncbi:hypothetical protein ACFL3X_01645, partial [Gemmatimonadota bacterium]